MSTLAMRATKRFALLSTFVLVASCGGRTLPSSEEGDASPTGPTVDGGPRAGSEAGGQGSEAAVGHTDGGVVPGGQLTITLDRSTTNLNGGVKGTVKNGTSKAVYLEGCGIYDRQHLEQGKWVSKGSSIDCFWEGNARELLPGASLAQGEYFESIGQWRLALPYGASCPTGVPLDLSKCKSSGTVTSATITVVDGKAFCDGLVKSYAQAMIQARKCFVSWGPPPCPVLVQSDLSCGCSIHVQDATALVAIQQSWIASSCSSYYTLCAGKCAAPPSQGDCINGMCEDDWGED
jgi:hypothetical protein